MKLPWISVRLNPRDRTIRSPTFNQTTMRFQKPIMMSSIGVAPVQAFESLMALTYI